MYPHKFRKTMATRAIEKGMPIEQRNFANVLEILNMVQISEGATALNVLISTGVLISSDVC